MGFFTHFWRLARLELLLVLSHARGWAALAVVACVPAIYLLIYLSSMWETAANTHALKVGLVNLDQGHVYQEQSAHIGREVVDELIQKGDFGYVELSDPEQAVRRVRDGELAFAIVIPPDFSAMALPARMANEGRLQVHVSAGNNYQTYLIAKKFTQELDADLNQALNRQRWKFVLSSAMASGDLIELRAALAKLQQGTLDLSTGLTEATRGSGKLTQGSVQLSDEVARLVVGTQQLGQYVRGIESSLPPPDDVRRLRIGAEELAAGHVEMDKALAQLHAGSSKLYQGVEQFRQNEQPSFPFFSSNLGEALDPLQTGLGELRDGLFKTQQGHRQLSTGAEQVRDSVRALAFGVRDMRASLRQVVAKLPESPQLAQISSGSQELASGQAQLDQGLRKLREGSVYVQTSTQWLLDRVPTEIRLIDGSPEGLAHSVAPELQVMSSVSHLGQAMVPNVLPVAVWLGASIALFLIRGRHLARLARHYGAPAKLLGKATVPVLVVTVQALILCTLLWAWFELPVRRPMALVTLMVSTAIAFVFVVLLFIRVAGDMGKALAMLMLALQISASGGVVPIELSGEFFSALSPWLPMTWMVQGLKAAIFDAYGGDWLTPLWTTLAMGAASAVLAMWVGRWREARLRHLRPALDL
jgi:putative membrane protein